MRIFLVWVVLFAVFGDTAMPLELMLVALSMFNVGHGTCLTSGVDYCVLRVFRCVSSHSFRENFTLCVRSTTAPNWDNQDLS